MVGDAALTVEPGRPGRVEVGDSETVTDRGLRGRPHRTGHARAARFSWGTSAELMREMFIDAGGR